MADDITIPVAAVTGSTGLVTLLIGWWKHNSRLKDADERLGRVDEKFERLEAKIDDGDKNIALQAASVAQNLSAFQLDAEKRYAKDEPIQATLARLHDRIDVLATREDVKELRDDIKKLMGKSGVA